MDLKFEGVDLEYKKAKNNLPESFWETYSQHLQIQMAGK